MPGSPLKHPKAAAAAVALFSATLAMAQEPARSERIAPFTSTFETGRSCWTPELSPAGQVVILVSLPDQALYVYRNGVRIGGANVSTGGPGHETPKGKFSIIQKAARHSSNLFKGKAMPFMQRLTWSGMALHGGDLPGHPASHGCVRMPLDFAGKLYAVTGSDTTVIVTKTAFATAAISSPGILLTTAPREITPSGAVVWKPEYQTSGPLSIVVSTSDGRVYVFRGGTEIGRAPVNWLQGMKGTYAYAATADTDASGRRAWKATYHLGGDPPDVRQISEMAAIDQEFVRSLRPLIVPGASLIFTDRSIKVSMLGKSGFEIVTTSREDL